MTQGCDYLEPAEPTFFFVLCLNSLRRYLGFILEQLVPDRSSETKNRKSKILERKWERRGSDAHSHVPQQAKQFPIDYQISFFLF